MQAVLGWLAAQPPVQWLAPAADLRIANFYATGIVQKQAAGTVNIESGTISPYADTHTFFAAGLQVA